MFSLDELTEHLMPHHVAAIQKYKKMKQSLAQDGSLTKLCLKPSLSPQQRKMVAYRIKTGQWTVTDYDLMVAVTSGNAAVINVFEKYAKETVDSLVTQQLLIVLCRHDMLPQFKKWLPILLDKKMMDTVGYHLLLIHAALSCAHSIFKFLVASSSTPEFDRELFTRQQLYSPVLMSENYTLEMIDTIAEHFTIPDIVLDDIITAATYGRHDFLDRIARDKPTLINDMITHLINGHPLPLRFCDPESFFFIVDKVMKSNQGPHTLGGAAFLLVQTYPTHKTVVEELYRRVPQDEMSVELGWYIYHLLADKFLTQELSTDKISAFITESDDEELHGMLKHCISERIPLLPMYPFMKSRNIQLQSTFIYGVCVRKKQV